MPREAGAALRPGGGPGGARSTRPLWLLGCLADTTSLLLGTRDLEAAPQDGSPSAHVPVPAGGPRAPWVSRAGNTGVRKLSPAAACLARPRFPGRARCQACRASQPRANSGSSINTHSAAQGPFVPKRASWPRMLPGGPCPQHGQLPQVAFSGQTPGPAQRGPGGGQGPRGGAQSGQGGRAGCAGRGPATTDPFERPRACRERREPHGHVATLPPRPHVLVGG